MHSRVGSIPFLLYLERDREDFYLPGYIARRDGLLSHFGTTGTKFLVVHTTSSIRR